MLNSFLKIYIYILYIYIIYIHIYIYCLFIFIKKILVSFACCYFCPLQKDIIVLIVFLLVVMCKVHLFFLVLLFVVFLFVHLVCVQQFFNHFLLLTCLTVSFHLWFHTRMSVYLILSRCSESCGAGTGNANFWFAMQSCTAGYCKKYGCTIVHCPYPKKRRRDHKRNIFKRTG